jgi:hypothetical protein
MCTKLINFSLKFFVYIVLQTVLLELKMRCIACTFMCSEKESLVFVFIPIGKLLSKYANFE